VVFSAYGCWPSISLRKVLKPAHGCETRTFEHMGGEWEMGSSYKRLAIMGAAIAALIVSAAFFGTTSSASAAKKSRAPSLTSPLTAAGSQFATPARHRLKRPKAPNVVLYDQYDNDSLNGTSSQNFEADFDAYDDETADDFVVPGGETWNVNQVDAAGQYSAAGPMTSANVNFYSD